MNNEETILDPQSVADSSANKSKEAPQAPIENNDDDKSSSKKNQKNNKKSNDLVSKVAASLIGVGVGVAGTMYASDVKDSIMPEAEESQSEAPNTPTAQAEEHHQKASSLAPEPKSVSTPQSPEPPVQDLGSEPDVTIEEVLMVDITGDGQPDMVYKLSNGLYLADTTGDGMVNFAMQDMDGDGLPDNGEWEDITESRLQLPAIDPSMYSIEEIPEDGIDVVEPSPVYTSLPEDEIEEDGVEVISTGGTEDEDDIVVTIEDPIPGDNVIEAGVEEAPSDEPVDIPEDVMPEPEDLLGESIGLESDDIVVDEIDDFEV